MCSTLQGEDLFLEGLDERFRSEARALILRHAADVDTFIAVSDYYARFMAGYLGIPAGKIRVAPLGITLDGLDASPRPSRTPFTIGYLARIAPEKGLDRLCAAYRRLRHDGRLQAARLEVAGYLGPEHRRYFAGIERQMDDWGLASEFIYRGVLDRQEKATFLRGLNAFSVPTRYHEPKGMFLLEAMACGVPVVQPRVGAFPEIVTRTSGGLLVEPDSEESLADGIARLADDPALASRLGQQGAAGVRAHYSVGAMADRVLQVYEDLAGPAVSTEAAASTTA